MSDALKLRRALYERLAALRRVNRLRPGSREQVDQLLRRAVAVRIQNPDNGPDDGSAGVREPRRPIPPAGPAAMHLLPPG